VGRTHTSPGFRWIFNVANLAGASLIEVQGDAAGIGRAVVLSVGNSYRNERKALNNPAA
jgi:hypothetical protein